MPVDSAAITGHFHAQKLRFKFPAPAAAAVDLELAIHLAAQRILRQHALDRNFDHALRVGSQQILQAHGLQVANVAGEAMILLVIQLGPGDMHLLRVDHHDIIAGVAMRGVFRLVLAAQTPGNFGRQATERLVRGVNHEPVALDSVCIGAEGFHFKIPDMPPLGGTRIRWIKGAR